MFGGFGCGVVSARMTTHATPNAHVAIDTVRQAASVPRCWENSLSSTDPIPPMATAAPVSHVSPAFAGPLCFWTY